MKVVLMLRNTEVQLRMLLRPQWSGVRQCFVLIFSLYALQQVEIGIEKSHNVAKLATKTDSFKEVKRKKCSTESEVDEGSKKKTKASHHQDGDKKVGFRLPLCVLY